jgi:iron complex transport system substrate-binding protein
VRVLSLLPAATEIVAALGHAGDLVGISHECDHPPEALHLPRVTSTPIDTAVSSTEIDAQVVAARAAGRAVIGVEADALRAARPELILTQGLCDVCAVSDGQVHRLAAAMTPEPTVLSLEARDFATILLDVRRIAVAIGADDAGRVLSTQLAMRLVDVYRGVLQLPPVERRVVCLEWLDPVYLAGHWVPELVAAAGGVDVGATPGSRSRRTTWPEVRALAPTHAIVMLCGFGVERSKRELASLDDADGRSFLRDVPTWILDGNAYTSRPGPRVVEGAERLQAVFRGEERDGLERWRPAIT